NLDAGQAACDTVQQYTFTSSGDGSLVQLTGLVNGLNINDSTLAGINVWDASSANTGRPSQIALPAFNPASPGPSAVGIDYVASVPGAVTVEVYNWTQTQVQISLTA